MGKLGYDVNTTMSECKDQPTSCIYERSSSDKPSRRRSLYSEFLQNPSHIERLHAIEPISAVINQYGRRNSKRNRKRNTRRKSRKV